MFKESVRPAALGKPFDEKGETGFQDPISVFADGLQTLHIPAKPNSQSASARTAYALCMLRVPNRTSS